MNLEKLLTETRSIATLNIDKASAHEIISMINQADSNVAKVVASEPAKIAQAADLITESLKIVGRLFYVGAGTIDRLGILDAEECPPTFGTSPNLVQGIIAGGTAALVSSLEESKIVPQQLLMN